MAPWGKNQALFGKTHQIFMNSEEVKEGAGTVHPNWKTLADRLKKHVVDCRKLDSSNTIAFGISEKYDKKGATFE